MASEPDGTREILLVDPTGGLQEHLEAELSAAGFGTGRVASAAECLVQVEEDSVHGVVSRYDLPDMDGPTLLRSIRLINPPLPVLLFPPADTAGAETASADMHRFVVDETEAKAVVAQLEGLMNREHESLQRYRHLLEYSPAPINIFDQEGNSIWCNDEVAAIFGLDSREELLGRSILELIHPDDREQARAEIASVIEEKEPTGPTRLKLRLDDGEVRYIRVATTPGRFLGADIGQAMAIDETERIERERQLKIVNHWLRHNIRNKMTAIIGVASDIQTQELNDIEDGARVIQEQAELLVGQADRARQINRILTTQYDHLEPVQVAELVDRVLKVARENYPDATLSVASTEPFQTAAIPELDLAIAELVDNAIRHNDAERPRVTVEVAERAGGHGVIRIKDEGPGIPEVEQRYLQLDQEIDQLRHGSSLGLVFVYWVVRLSGGTITITCDDPWGNVVTIKLPKA